MLQTLTTLMHKSPDTQVDIGEILFFKSMSTAHRGTPKQTSNFTYSDTPNMSTPAVNLTANFTGPFRLYDLPQELCDLILAQSSINLPRLHHICKRGEATIHLELLPKHRRKGAPRLRIEKLHSYVLSHKHFYHELFAYGGWTAKCESVHPLTCIFLSSKSMASVALRRARWSLDAIGCVCRRKKPASQDGRIDAGFNDSLHKASSLLKRLGHLELNSTGSRTLWVAFGLDTWSFRTVNEETIVDLSGLELAVDGLDKLVVQVAMDDFRSDETRKWLCRGIEQFGFAMFGEGRVTKFEYESNEFWKGEVYRA